MAFSYQGERGNYGTKTVGSSTAVSPSQAISSGQLLIVVVVTDNVGTSQGATTNHSVSDTQGNSYTRLEEYTRTDGGSGDGVTTSIHFAELSTGLGTGDTVTASHATIVAHAIGLWEFSTAGGVTKESSAGATGTGTSPSTSLSGLTNQAYVLLHATGLEEKQTMSWTADSDYTAVATMIGSGTAGSGVSNICGQLEYRLATLTSDTCAPTPGSGADWSTAYAALYEAGGGATVTMDALSLAGSVPSGTVAPGEVTPLMDALSLASSAQALSVSAVTAILMDALSLAGSVPSGTVAPGEVAPLMDALSLAGTAQALSVSPGAVALVMDALALVGTVPSGTVAPGAVALVMDALSLISSAPTLTVSVISGLIVAMDALSLASSAQALSLSTGAVALVMDALSLAGTVPSGTVAPGEVALLMDALSLASSAQALSVSPGAVALVMDALSLAGTVPTLTVSSISGVIVVLAALSLASSAQALSVRGPYTPTSQLIWIVPADSRVFVVSEG